MLGVCYLLICFLVGKEITDWIALHIGKPTIWKSPWVSIPAWFFTGTLSITWAVYLMAYLFQIQEKPLVWANGLVLITSVCFLTVRYWKKQRLEIRNASVCKTADFQKEAIGFLLLAVFTTFIMFWVFHISDGRIRFGNTIFSDFSPHTAVIRSFSWMNNFPTQYPHFGGEDIRYHFMFMFLAGNLEFLGMRLDYAFNVISIFSFLGMGMLLFSFAKWFLKRTWASWLCIAFMLFRSSPTFFRYVWEHLQSGDLLQAFRDNASLIGYTPNENWGLWCINVYLNQRHYAFGIGILLILLLIFYSYLEESFSTEKESLAVWWQKHLFSKKYWESIDWKLAVAAGVLLGLTSFWNGACVITTLLFLFGFAICSKGKLDYLITAGLTLLFSNLESKIFVKESVVDFHWCFGFIAENKTLTGVLIYFLELTGILVIFILLSFVLLKGVQRYLSFVFLIPLVFSFTISLTSDVTVNHKYIMLSFTMLGLIVAALLVRFWEWAKLGKGVKLPVMILLVFVLTITGFYEAIIDIRGNDKEHSVSIAEDNETTLWLKDHMTSDDLLLTSNYALSPITISGVPLYYGWPYFAWSAGYDTGSRDEKWKTMFLSSDWEETEKLLLEERITYVVFENGMSIDETSCDETKWKDHLTLVYSSRDGLYRIYQVVQ